MPRKVHNALTALSVKNAGSGRHADGGGLYLLVKESGARSWVFRYMIRGNARDMGLGAAGQGGMSLSAARDAALALRAQVKAGIDPIEAQRLNLEKGLAETKAATIANVTFRDVAEQHIGMNENSWKNDKHRQQWRNTLISYVYPVIGEIPVGDVDTHHVLQILEPIWHCKAETASRVRGRIETVLNAAKAKGYRTGENPAAWRGHLALILPPAKKLARGHHKALPYAEMPMFLQTLKERKATAALALEFTILTAARTSEVLEATWEEVDLQKALWTIPAVRMKAGKEHRVPLSERAIEILHSMRPLKQPHLFPSDKGGPLSPMAMSMLLRRMNIDATVHGFRSTFRDWTAECTQHPHEVAELALAHTIGNKAEAAYRRGDMMDKRRRLMEDWLEYLSGR